jgi:hypothetical protein
MSVWQTTRAAGAALTRTVTGAILAPHETQRLVVSGKRGIYSSATPEKSTCASIDLSGEMVTPLLHRFVTLRYKLEPQLDPTSHQYISTPFSKSPSVISK